VEQYVAFSVYVHDLHHIAESKGAKNFSVLLVMQNPYNEDFVRLVGGVSSALRVCHVTSQETLPLVCKWLRWKAPHFHEMFFCVDFFQRLFQDVHVKTLSFTNALYPEVQFMVLNSNYTFGKFTDSSRVLRTTAHLAGPARGVVVSLFCRSHIQGTRSHS
jgi:hypothetical protein